MSDVERTPYDDTFFGEVEEGSLRSARAVVPIVVDFVAPTSVVDVGCGTGGWLLAFQEHGIDDFLGIDGDYIDKDRLLVPRSRFMEADLLHPIRLDRTFDLVVSLEVAEHLPPESATSFVEFLTSLGSIILFSAAVPNQGGTNHLNEQPQDYWAALFDEFEFEPVDWLRDRIWDNEDIDWWYIQNSIIYRRSSLRRPKRDRNRICGEQPMSLNRIHPRMEVELDWRLKTSRLRETLLQYCRGIRDLALAGLDTIFLERIEGVHILPFLEREGRYWGPPGDAGQAIAELERMRLRGVQAVGFPWSTWWILEAYREFAAHLEANYRCICNNEVIQLWDLR